MTTGPLAPHVVVQGLRVAYADGAVTAVDGLDLQIGRGEFVCLLGPSGCGKSTILNTIAGFTKPAAGRVVVDSLPVAGPGPDRGVVFQSYALFLWRTVRGNVEFGLRAAGIRGDELRERTDSMLRAVELLDRAAAYPHELSGGMQQRVALARALVTTPSVLVMDEPFGSLDAQTRARMQQLTLDLWARQTTVVFVTHDVDESIFLADRVVVLTNRPARVKREFRVALPRPRNTATKLSDDFLELKRQVSTSLEEEQA